MFLAVILPPVHKGVAVAYRMTASHAMPPQEHGLIVAELLEGPGRESERGMITRETQPGPQPPLKEARRDGFIDVPRRHRRGFRHECAQFAGPYPAHPQHPVEPFVNAPQGPGARVRVEWITLLVLAGDEQVPVRGSQDEGFGRKLADFNASSAHCAAVPDVNAIGASRFDRALGRDFEPRP